MNKLSSLFYLFFVTIQAYNIQRQFIANSTQNLTTQSHDQSINSGSQNPSSPTQEHHNASGKGFVLNHHLDSLSVEKEKAVEHIQYYETPDAKPSSKNRIVHPQANNMKHPKNQELKFQHKSVAKPHMRHHPTAKHHLQANHDDNGQTTSSHDQSLQNQFTQLFTSDEPQDQALTGQQESPSDNGSTTSSATQPQEAIDYNDESLLPNDFSDQEPSAAEIQTESTPEIEDQETDNVAGNQQWPSTDQNEQTAEATEEQGPATVPPQVQTPVTSAPQTPSPVPQQPQVPSQPLYPVQATTVLPTTTQPPPSPTNPPTQLSPNAYPPPYQAPAGYPSYAATTQPPPQPQTVSSFQQPSSPIQVCPSQIENVGCYNVGGAVTQLLPTLVSSKQSGQTLEELLCACAYIAQKNGWTLLAISQDSCYSGQNAAPFENGGLANSCINDSGSTCGPNDEYCQGVAGSASIYKVIPEAHRSKVSKKLPKKH